MSQYVKLGTQCESQTMSALTSNTKYIMPLSNAYYKKWTPMMCYPSMNQIYGEKLLGEDREKFFGEDKEPATDKAYSCSS